MSSIQNLLPRTKIQSRSPQPRLCRGEANSRSWAHHALDHVVAQRDRAWRRTIWIALLPRDALQLRLPSRQAIADVGRRRSLCELVLQVELLARRSDREGEQHVSSVGR